MPNKAPFPIQAELTAVAIAYKNKDMIADRVAPRVPVGTEEFKYMKHTMEEGFTVPDTKVGRKSKPNEVSFSGTEVTDSTEDFGLDDPIPQKDIDQAPANYDPKAKSVEYISNLVELDREIRVAGLVFNAANYSVGYKQTLAGVTQFSDFASSDPIGVIMDALDAMIMRANVMTIGRRPLSILSRHPDIVKATHGNSGDKGIAQRQAIAELFELEEILVGASFVNNARKGQPVSMARVWGNHIALINRDMNADTRNGLSFAMTAQFGNRVAGSHPDPDIGLRGGERVRAGESVKELLTAPDLGYFIQDAVAP